MAIPNPNYVASVPLQYVFRDKDTGFPLSAGVVKFFKDPQWTIPKDVFQISNGSDNEVVFTNLGSELTLSSIGTFVDETGNNLVPYYYPYDEEGEEQLYFIQVYSSGQILQFTLDYWPPNSLSNSGNETDEALTANQITNPQFSVVSFTPDPSTGVYQYSVSGTDTRNPVAPGWELVTTGTGTVSVSQQSLAVDIPSEAPYALRITSVSTVSLTSVKLVQRLTNSPRILGAPDTVEPTAIAGYLVASSAIGQTVPITMTYEPSDSDTIPTLLFSDTTEANGSYKVMTDANDISLPLSTDNASGYVDIVIDIGVGTTVNITSAQLVNVNTINDTPAFIQQTTQQQLNGLMWYYEPQLAAKPIPNYAIGWDFPFNPCQPLGKTVTPISTAANSSRYFFDQTIIFTTVNNTLGATITDDIGLNIATGATTSFALIQYLDTTTAQELLSGRMAVMIKSKATVATNAQINLYWTEDATLPNPPISTNFDSLVSAVSTAGVPTVGSGGDNGDWTAVPRSGLGTAWFTTGTTAYSTAMFNGWDATAVDTSAATFFAIVVSFADIASTTQVQIPFITLCKGDIATAPAPMNKAQTLQALQYYYESSYNNNVVPGSVSIGALICAQQAYTNGGTTVLAPTSFCINYRSKKRTNAVPITYAASSGAADNVTGVVVNNGAASSAGEIAITQWTLSASEYQASYVVSSGTGTVASASVTQPLSAYISFHYTADARLGQV